MGPLQKVADAAPRGWVLPHEEFDAPDGTLTLSRLELRNPTQRAIVASVGRNVVTWDGWYADGVCPLDEVLSQRHSALDWVAGRLTHDAFGVDGLLGDRNAQELLRAAQVTRTARILDVTALTG